MVYPLVNPSDFPISQTQNVCFPSYPNYTRTFVRCQAPKHVCSGDISGSFRILLGIWQQGSTSSTVEAFGGKVLLEALPIGGTVGGAIGRVWKTLICFDLAALHCLLHVNAC